jgi:hypothetical protein
VSDSRAKTNHERIESLSQEVTQALDRAALSPTESVEEWQRLQARLSTHSGAWWVWGKRGLALAAGCAMLLSVWLRPRETQWAEAVSRQSALCLHLDDLRADLPATCPQPVELSLAGEKAVLMPGTTLAREEKRLRLRQGRVTFEVRPRTSAEPQFVLAVSHGLITVIGTRFTVLQGQQSGTVAVERGQVQFRADDGTLALVDAGQSLSWPRPAPRITEPVEPEEVAPTSRDKATEPTVNERKAPASFDINALTDRLVQLRGQRRYAEAVALLEAGIAHPSATQRQRESLSTELGLVLTTMGETARACAHWREHVARFGKSTVVAAELQRCP